MSLYRCACCGSSNVKTDKQTSGVKYNYAKGAIGTVALGVGGAIAGIENKTEQVYKCPDCGLTLSYCMSDELKNIIDIAISAPETRDHLQLHGIHIEWSYLTNKYRNICDSQEISANTGNFGNNEGKATQEEFDAAVDFIRETERKFSKSIRNENDPDLYN